MIVDFDGSFVVLDELEIYDTIEYSDIEGLNEKVGSNESAWIVIDDGDVSSTIRITNNGTHFTLEEPLDRTITSGTCVYSSESAQRLEDEFDEIEICTYPAVETEEFKFIVCEDGEEKFLTIDQLKEALGIQDILDRLEEIEGLDSCDGECQETDDLLAGDMLTIRRNNTECKLIDVCAAITRCQQLD